MDVLELPRSLQGVLDGLNREVTGALISSSIRRQLQQAQSPLSLVRQDAYANLAGILDGYLRDPAKAPAVLPALARAWPELLQSVALGLRQAPPGGTPRSGQPSPGSAAALAYRSVSPAELTCLVRVLQLACLLAGAARHSSLGAGLLPLLLAQLPAAPPELACAALDAVLAIQMRCPPAFVSFVELGGVGQVSHLLRDHATPEPVRSHVVQFLNLLLTQLVPELLPADALPPASPAPGAPPTPGPGQPACEGQPEVQAAVLAALDSAKVEVEETLGREARAMLMRRVSLSDVSAEAKLGQLSSALTLFIESDA